MQTAGGGGGGGGGGWEMAGSSVPSQRRHESCSVGAWRTGAHITTVLRARQPPSNYCEASQSASLPLLRHALNFAQDRWGPTEYAAESALPSRR